MCVGAWLLCGCTPRGQELYVQFQHEDPAVRLQAVRRAGQLKDPKSIPYFIDRLTDSEREIRMFAIVALEKITGQTMGYRHYGPRAERAEAVRRWRQWLERRQEGGAATRPREKPKT